MNENIASIIRHILTALGGVLVTKGIMDEGTLMAIIGGVMGIIGVVWGQTSKK